MDQFNIFLIGFMGTGKTTIANCLSRKLDRKVVEMDQIISERAGMSISDIFKTYGEQHFRDLETGLLVETQSGMPVIVSCGGGTPMRECNVREMRKNGRIVLLTAKPETIGHCLRTIKVLLILRNFWSSVVKSMRLPQI